MTSGYEIDKALQKLKISYSVKSKDNLSDYKEPSVGVVNLQDSNLGLGTHWVAYYIPKSGSVNYYFDSYGLPPPIGIIKHLKTKNRSIIYSDQQLQGLKTDLCGEYVIYWLRNMLRRRNASTNAYNNTKYLGYIYSVFDPADVKGNDKKIKDLIKIRINSS